MTPTNYRITTPTQPRSWNYKDRAMFWFYCCRAGNSLEVDKRMKNLVTDSSDPSCPELRYLHELAEDGDPFAADILKNLPR